MSDSVRRTCIDCAVTSCNKEGQKYPDFCLTTSLDEDFKDNVLKCYEEEENKRTMIAAAEVEYEGYCQLTRVEEIIEFARKIGARKIGIATCAGLISESRTLAKILRIHGFEVFGVICKIGAIDKVRVGIAEECNAVGSHMCNPIMQAELLNKEETDLNVVVGLCVGHDSLFYKYSKALTTTAVTKDRVLGHNPAAALYTSASYYKKLMKED